MEEIEAKFLDVNVDELKSKLINLGAVFVGEFLYKRKTYDFADYSLNNNNSWVRVRDEGDRVTMTYKKRLDADSATMRDGGMKEVEVVVSDFNLTDQFLQSIGMVEKFYEENKRERYILDNVEVDIDTWPMIPSYVELEGGDWGSVERVAEKLGFDWVSHLRCSTMQIYKSYGINENDYAVITFIEQIKK